MSDDCIKLCRENYNVESSEYNECVENCKVVDVIQMMHEELYESEHDDDDWDDDWFDEYDFDGE